MGNKLAPLYLGSIDCSSPTTSAPGGQKCAEHRHSKALQAVPGVPKEAYSTNGPKIVAERRETAVSTPGWPGPRIQLKQVLRKAFSAYLKDI